MEDFERLLTHQPSQTTKESFEYGEIDAALNFQPLTEAQMVQQSQSALEAYRRTGSAAAHNRVREWADSYGEENSTSNPSLVNNSCHCSTGKLPPEALSCP